MQVAKQQTETWDYKSNFRGQKKYTKFNNGILRLIWKKFHFEIIHSVCLGWNSFIKPTMRKIQTYLKVRPFTTNTFFGMSVPSTGISYTNHKTCWYIKNISSIIIKYIIQQQNYRFSVLNTSTYCRILLKRFIYIYIYIYIILVFA